MATLKAKLAVATRNGKNCFNFSRDMADIVRDSIASRWSFDCCMAPHSSKQSHQVQKGLPLLSDWTFHERIHRKMQEEGQREHPIAQSIYTRAID